jgi:hypothetical protein
MLPMLSIGYTPGPARNSEALFINQLYFKTRSYFYFEAQKPVFLQYKYHRNEKS